MNDLIAAVLSSSPIWMSSLLGSFVSLFFVPNITVARALAAIICGLFCSIMFTSPMMSLMNLKADMMAPTAGLLGLTGYELVRRLISEDGGIVSSIDQRFRALFSSAKKRDKEDGP